MLFVATALASVIITHAGHSYSQASMCGRQTPRVDIVSIAAEAELPAGKFVAERFAELSVVGPQGGYDFHPVICVGGATGLG